MKRTPLNKISKKMQETAPQRQIREAYAQHKASLKPKAKRIPSRKTYVEGVLCDSQWEAEKYRELLLLQRAGLIMNLEDHKTITFKIYNEAGDAKQFQINIDFEFFDKELNRWVRHDRKSTKKLVKRNQASWLHRWELLQFAEPYWQYELEYMG